MNEKIQIFIDSNERNSDRANALILAAAKDPRFDEPVFAELDVDVCFSWQRKGEQPCEDCIGVGCAYTKCVAYPRHYLAELKEPADYVSSALGKPGHLYQQYLDMAEAGHTCMILVLGSDDDVHKAIFESLITRYHGQERVREIASYHKRLIHFESCCEALGCPVERWDDMPYSRLLSRVAKRLEGKASLMDYRPRPAEEERKVAALSMLLGNGIGESKAAAILEKFDLKLESKFNRETCRGYSLTDCKGLGPKLAARIRERVEVIE